MKRLFLKVATQSLFILAVYFVGITSTSNADVLAQMKKGLADAADRVRKIQNDAGGEARRLKERADELANKARAEGSKAQDRLQDLGDQVRDKIDDATRDLCTVENPISRLKKSLEFTVKGNDAYFATRVNGVNPSEFEIRARPNGKTGEKVKSYSLELIDTTTGQKLSGKPDEILNQLHYRLECIQLKETPQIRDVAGSVVPESEQPSASGAEVR
ncbi:DUF883 domain-containing protein [bacterium]|nr:DUF883 domain-containing protein [bacterium]